MPTTLITGSNRGLGLEFVRQYAEDGWTVHATCRKPEEANELKSLATASQGKITVHALDVGHHQAILSLADTLSDTPIDLLLNNAGVYPDRGGLGHIDYDTWGQAMNINTFGPVRMAESFVDLVAKSERKLLVNVTSKMGSIDDNSSGGSYIYRSSKAALNMATKCLALDLRSRGIIALVVHPGWVQTDMGGGGAPLSVEESVSGMRQVIDGLDANDNGKFYGFDGNEIPW